MLWAGPYVRLEDRHRAVAIPIRVPAKPQCTRSVPGAWGKATRDALRNNEKVETGAVRLPKILVLTHLQSHSVARVNSALSPMTASVSSEST